MKEKELILSECSLDGIVLVEASAGTGKTYSITRIVLRLLLEKNLEMEEIAIVTFTEASRYDLIGRMRSVLQNALEDRIEKNDELTRILSRIPENERREILSRALASFDRAAILTIHGFCHRILREFAFETGSLFESEVIADTMDLKRAAAGIFWRKKMKELPEFFAAYCLEAGFLPEKLASFLNDFAAHPGMELHPFESVDLPDSLDKLEKLYRDTQLSWKNGSREQADELLRSPGVNRNRVKDPQKSLSRMDEFLSFSSITLASPLLDVPGILSYLSNPGLTSLLKNGYSAPGGPFHDLCEALCDEMRKMKNTLALFSAGLYRECLEFAEEYASQRKRAANAISYDDMLEFTKQAVEKSPDLRQAVRKRYRAVVVDEFQDTDPVQWFILRGIFKNGPLFLIGDPKQSIYSFRGADMGVYLRARNESSSLFTLTKNFRSTNGMVQAVNRFFDFPSPNPGPFLNRDIRFHRGVCGTSLQEIDETAPLQILFLPDNDGTLSRERAKTIIGENVCAEIQRLIATATLEERGKKRPVSPADIAVIVRTNSEAAIIKELLSFHRIRSTVRSEKSVFQSSAAKELARLLTAVENPGRERNLRTAFAGRMMGWSGNAIDCVFRRDFMRQRIMMKFFDYRQSWEKYGFTRMFQSLLAREKIRERTLRLPDGERILTDLLHLAELIQGAGQKNPQADIKWLQEKIIESAENKIEHQIRLESEESAVRIITIHNSKGLEFPIVMCPFAWSSGKVSPIYRRSPEEKRFLVPDHKGLNDYLKEIGQKEEIDSLAKKEQLEEEIRLLYVSLTRASRRCYIYLTKFKKSGDLTASSWVLYGKNTFDWVECRERLKAMTGDDVLRELESLRDTGFISVSAIDEETEFQESSEEEDIQLKGPRVFKGRIRSRKTSSFASLLYRKESEEAEKDQFRPLEKIEEEKVENTIFHFPGGSRSGIFFHEILENLSFQASQEEARSVIAQKLRDYRFDETCLDPVARMIDDLFHAPLYPGKKEFCLAAVKQKKQEMDFLFPVSNVDAGELRSQSGLPSSLRSCLEMMNYVIPEGFLKGFIDLVFEFEGRYYLADWKSNRLGISHEDYLPENLSVAMNKDGYFLQYYIYLSALHLYLSRRLKDYDYDTHFGGVLYIFLRGIHPKKDTGIFRDRPDREWVDRFTRLLGGKL